MKKFSNEKEVRAFVSDAIADRFGTLTAYADKEEVSVQYLCNVLAGRKRLPEWLLKRFKIKHVVQQHWETA